MSDTDFEEQLRQENLEKAKDESTYRTYTDADGTVFEWDAQKKAYFPKIDDDFIAKYQMSYGLSTEQETSKEGTSGEDTKTEEEKRKEYEQYCKDYYNYYYGSDNQTGGENGEKGGHNSTKGSNSKDEEYSYDDYFAYYSYYYGQNSGEGKEGEGVKDEETPEGKNNREGKDDKAEDKEKVGEKRKADAGWFDHDSEKSTHIYVSGLPLDITDDEYKELMNKYGLIMYDHFTRKPKLKLYKDENGQPKGDGLCCYIKQESVDLALNLLDGSDVRGHKVSVDRAQFQMKGQYDPGKKRKKLSNKDKRKMKEKQAKLFDWRPEKEDGGRQKWEKTVVLKNMFDPKEFEENPMVINELSVDVRAEASKFGDVKKVTVYDRHADGVITVKYKEAEEADMCVSNLNGRWFAKRRIIAQTWDGKTKYDVEETEEEREARLKKWETFLEKAEDSSGAASHVTSSVPLGTSAEPAVTSVPVGTSAEPAVTSVPVGTSAEPAVTSVPVGTSAEPAVTSPVPVSGDASATPNQSSSLTVESQTVDKEGQGESALAEAEASKESSSEGINTEV